MSLQHLKEQEIAEWKESAVFLFPVNVENAKGYGASPYEFTYNGEKIDISEWIKQHDLRLEQAIREEERSKLREALEGEISLYGEEGKLFSKVAAKCMEAPFPEVAIQHSFRRVDERAKKSFIEEIDTILDRYDAGYDEKTHPLVLLKELKEKVLLTLK